MSIKLTVVQNALDAGEHEVILASAREIKDDRFGDLIEWVFENGDGQYRKRTGKTIRRDNLTYKIVTGLAGRELEIGDNIDLDDFVGKKFRLVLAEEDRDGDAVVVITNLSPL